MQTIGHPAHNMKNAQTCRNGHSFCKLCMHQFGMYCTQCSGLACPSCPGDGLASCPDCTAEDREQYHPLCDACHEQGRFKCCQKAAIYVRCDRHHMMRPLCMCGEDVCDDCMQRRHCVCGEFEWCPPLRLSEKAVRRALLSPPYGALSANTGGEPVAMTLDENLSQSSQSSV